MHIHLYSSGIDSFIGSLFLQQEIGDAVIPVYFNLGHRYSRNEILLIKKTKPHTHIIENILNLSHIEDVDAHIPFRNVLLITTVASLYAYAEEDICIYINSMADDRVSDQGKTFIEQMNDLLNQHKVKANYIVQSSMPLDWTKFDAVDWYLKEGYPVEWLRDKTFSCYNPPSIDQHCFACPACFRRNTVLYYAGIKTPFYNKELAEKYLQSLTTNKYPPKRKQAMASYLGWLFSEGPLA